jgi:hypothetical protein
VPTGWPGLGFKALGAGASGVSAALGNPPNPIPGEFLNLGVCAYEAQ